MCDHCKDHYIPTKEYRWKRSEIYLQDMQSKLIYGIHKHIILYWHYLTIIQDKRMMLVIYEPIIKLFHTVPMEINRTSAKISETIVSGIPRSSSNIPQ